MAEFFAEYGLFLLKTVTIVIGIIAVIAVAAAAGRKASHEGLEVEDLNKKYRNLADALRKAVSTKDEQKKAAKERKKADKAESKEPSGKPRSFVIDFKGDLKASAVSSLREEVSAILDVATSEDVGIEEVLGIKVSGNDRRLVVVVTEVRAVRFRGVRTIVGKHLAAVGRVKPYQGNVFG